MTRVLIALAFAGCTGQRVEQPPTPVEPPAAEPAGEAPVMGLTETEPRQIVAEPGSPGVVDALAAAGACKIDGRDQPRRVLAWTLAHGGELFAAECSKAEGDDTWEWFSAWSLDHVYAPVMDQDGKPVRFVGFPEFDKATGTATWLSKGQEDGTCGDWYRYRVADQKMTLEEHRRRACDAQGDGADPSEWPLAD